MKPKEGINGLNDRPEEFVTLKLEPDDNINAAFMSLSLVHHLQAVGAPEDNVQASRKRMRNLAIEKSKLGVTANNNDDAEQKMSEQSTNKVNPSTFYGEMCKPRTNQKLLEADFNGFCPTLINTSHENKVIQVKPMIQSSFSLSHDMERALHIFNFMPNEMTWAMYEGSNLPPPKTLVNPWIEETISKSLSDMDISMFNKRKRDLLEPLEMFLSNKRTLKEDILEAVVKVEPGRASGCRRLSGIKQAARAKYVKEIERKFDDETGLLEFGRDPFGKRIINIPTFNSSHSHILTEVDEFKCDEDAKFFLFANDVLDCSVQRLCVCDDDRGSNCEYKGDPSPTLELFKRNLNGCKWKVLAKKSSEPLVFSFAFCFG
ncbi:hypothetical protein V6N12_043377 [Hibiscus sabdariffa]|uniref:Uncharacterized protein n=1 Tax=Hibiscus sabdariffa TaxID=183260 RepID=A0ABR2DFV6_9ROSI